MRRATWLELLIGLAVVPCPHAQAAAPAAARGPRLEAVTLGIRHRAFPDFCDVQRVKLNREFIIGDSEYSARVIQYVPDFQMDLEHHRIFSLTNQPRNPALRIVVSRNRAPHDTSWAFLKSPPHFGARSYFAFQVLRIDFVGRPPLLADSSLAAPPATGGPIPAPARHDSSRSR